MLEFCAAAPSGGSAEIPAIMARRGHGPFGKDGSRKISMHVDDFESQQQRRSSRNMVSPPGGVRGPGFSSRLLLRVQLKGLGLRFDGDGWRAVVELLQTGWDRRGCCEVDWAVCRDDKALPSCSLLGTAWQSVSQGQRQMKHHCLPCHTHTPPHPHTHTHLSRTLW